MLFFRYLVKGYLDATKQKAKRFKNNLPGYDWGVGFLKRHCISQRVVENIKRVRAKINPETVNMFFYKFGDCIRRCSTREHFEL